MNRSSARHSNSADKQNVASSPHPSQPPVVSLPKGGGAARGIDEKYQVNPVTGSAAMRIPIAVSLARQGFSPQLALNYDSSSGHSDPFGLGWTLSLPQITRKTDKGLPTYQDGDASDTFIFSGADDLVPMLVAQAGEDYSPHQQVRSIGMTIYIVQRYRPRIEGLFARIERWTDQQTGQTHWRTITRDNVTTLYGRTPESQIVDPDFPLRVFSWRICESYDDKGNAILYRYKSENSDNIDFSQVHERNRSETSRSSNRYIKQILYGNQTPHTDQENLQERTDWIFRVVFDYGEGHLQRLSAHDDGEHFVEAALSEQQTWPVRHDAISGYRAGFEVRTYRLCQRVLMFHHFPEELGVEDYLVRATHFGYNENPINTVLNSVTQSSYLRQQDGTYQERSLPPVEFEYSHVKINSEVHAIDAESLQNLPIGVGGTQYQWVDLDGEGLAGILTEQGSGWFYKPNLGGGSFGAQERLPTKPSTAVPGSGYLLLDLAGDGMLDVVTFDHPIPGFYKRTEDRSWTEHKTFDSLPTIDWHDPNMRLVDLSGDGHADILITDERVLTWYPSLAEAGFSASQHRSYTADTEAGPHVVFADGTQSIYLADMSGDGLPDLVRIRNGSVCYWPNLGYGRFGAKVTMDHAPWFDTPDLFEQQRIRLADIDGSGITDILYLHHDYVAVYLNQAGNSWADIFKIAHVPLVDSLSDIAVTDLLGNGTACLVWSSPLPHNAGRQMRFIDLMGGQKPHLLIVSRNNLGAETRVQYAASTKFYLEDKAAGQDWITRLPFPVHVVERTETYDHISRNRFVSQYRYHHGYFDGYEREFRGFGMVEQLDTEEFAALSAEDTTPTPDNIDATSHVPPVLTRSWFHTGAYMEGLRISRLYSEEYYHEAGLSTAEFEAQLLPDTVMPTELDAETEREAVRTLKGSLLRQEIYALDASALSRHPYMVTEQNFTIVVIQPQGPNRHAVFLTHERETISRQYERNPTDPRISHSAVLMTDAFGNVRQAISLGYGRRQPDLALDADDQNRQGELLISATETDYTNAIDENDAYRTPLPSEERSYEVRGLQLEPNETKFSLEQLQQAVDDAVVLMYHDTFTPDTLQKRLLKQARTIYRRDDLTGALQLGELEALGLTFDSYQLVMTPEHQNLVFGDRVTEAMLTDEGRYVHFAGDADWWSQTGRAFLSPSPTDDAAQEMAFARQHFFMPQRFEDPFGQVATVEYDNHRLLMVRSTDALANQVNARYDYRLLVPDMVTTPNGNRSVVAFDVLGLVAGTVMMGKETETIGDSLDGFQAQLTQAQIDAFFADPRGAVATELLGNATSRLIYDEGRFQREGEPPYAAMIVRETHHSQLETDETSVVQVSLAYSDGFGRTIQSKVQAEAGSVGDAVEEIDPRWMTSGWTIFNNKGSPVRQYEPFFSATHSFEFGITVGVSPTLFYDPLERVVAVLHPNHTWEKIVFDAWRQESWDVNDTVLVDDPASDPDVGGYFARLPMGQYLPTWHQARIDGALGSDEQDAAQKAAGHALTPSIVYFDSLGRPYLSIADNGADERYVARTEQDVEGKLLRMIDNRGNVVMSYQVETAQHQRVPGYDQAGRQLYAMSMDAGESWALSNVASKPVRSWDCQGQRLRTTYDELQRVTRLFVQQGNDPEILAERTIYGENHPNAESLNLRGQRHQIYDSAGVATNQRFDFKGNLLENSRQFSRHYRSTPDWSVLSVLTTISEIEAVAAPLLENEVFTTQTTYDALDRQIAVTTPDHSVTIPTYNEANLLEMMAVKLRGAAVTTLFVDDIDYNARGQRELISYATEDGANFTTTYSYDPGTFQLSRLHTVRHQDGVALQDIRFTYDPVGNITSIRDDAQQTVFFSNVRVEPHCSFTYDPMYRLIRAEGREHAAQNIIQRDATAFTPLIGVPQLNSPNALQRYVETYGYDTLGNITSIRHIGGLLERWTRRYQYAVESNRLLATSLPEDGEELFSAHYAYDARGNMVQMPQLPLMTWDFKNRLQSSAGQATQEGTPEITYYVYNADGERVRKVTERQAVEGVTPTRRRERYYLGGMEIYREYAGDGSHIALERETLHVMDDLQRVALVETRTQGTDDSPAQVICYQLRNQLGSATIELDRVTAAVISYEEYHPFGTTAYCAGRSLTEISVKRYRFTAKEQDEESGLYYFGTRYYAAWLGRWTAPDPLGIAEGLNLYQYVSNNPIRMIDPSGQAAEDADTRTIHVRAGSRQDALVSDLESFDKETAAYKKARAAYNREYWHYLSASQYYHPQQRAELNAYYYHYYHALNRWARDLKAESRVLSARVKEAQRLAPFFRSMRTAETAIKYWAAADLVLVTGGMASMALSAEQASAYAIVNTWRVESAIGALSASSPMLARIATSPITHTVGGVSAAVLEADSLAQGGVPEAGRAVGIKIKGQSGRLFRSIEPGTEQLAFNFEQRTVFSGHGAWRKKASGFIKVPAGTTLTVYTKKGQAMGDRLGQAIELNVDLAGVYQKVYKPGQRVPNFTLYPPNGPNLPRLTLMGKPTTVTQPTELRDLLKANMGACHWAACFIIDN